MEKYLHERIDTHLRLALNHMQEDRLKQLAIEMALLLAEINRLEINRVKRYKNLKQRGIRSKVLVLVQKQLGKMM